jgi:hypothetical protein
MAANVTLLDDAAATVSRNSNILILRETHLSNGISQRDIADEVHPTCQASLESGSRTKDSDTRVCRRFMVVPRPTTESHVLVQAGWFSLVQVDIGGSEIDDALMVSQMIIVSDEVADLNFEIARKIISQAGCGSSASGAIVRSCLGSEDVAARRGCDRSRCLLAIRRDCLRCNSSRCRSAVLAAERR